MIIFKMIGNQSTNGTNSTNTPPTKGGSTVDGARLSKNKVDPLSGGTNTRTQKTAQSQELLNSLASPQIMAPYSSHPHSNARRSNYTEESLKSSSEGLTNPNYVETSEDILEEKSLKKPVNMNNKSIPFSTKKTKKLQSDKTTETGTQQKSSHLERKKVHSNKLVYYILPLDILLIISIILLFIAYLYYRYIENLFIAIVAVTVITLFMLLGTICYQFFHKSSPSIDNKSESSPNILEVKDKSTQCLEKQETTV